MKTCCSLQKTPFSKIHAVTAQLTTLFDLRVCDDITIRHIITFSKDGCHLKYVCVDFSLYCLVVYLWFSLPGQLASYFSKRVSTTFLSNGTCSNEWHSSVRWSMNCDIPLIYKGNTVNSGLCLMQSIEFSTDNPYDISLHSIGLVSILC